MHCFPAGRPSGLGAAVIGFTSLAQERRNSIRDGNQIISRVQFPEVELRSGQVTGQKWSKPFASSDLTGGVARMRFRPRGLVIMSTAMKF